MALSVLESLPCSLPTETFSNKVDAENVIASFEQTLTSLDISNFSPDALWRDICALTGSYRTFYGDVSILTTWRTLARSAQLTKFKYEANSARVVHLGDASWIEGYFTFQANDAPPRNCTAIVSLVPGENGAWRIWVLRTFIDQLNGHPSVDNYPAASQQNRAADTPLERWTKSNAFDCVVVGAGQAGLSVAGRLQSQRIKYVLLEKYGAVGDSWAMRYDSTKLHTTRASSHLPFDRTFPSKYPQYLTKEDLARGYSEWADRFGINVWLSTTLVAGQWDENKKLWTLELLRNGTRATVTTRHMVMCIGAGCQIPFMPTYPSSENYRGDTLHSVDYRAADKWCGKRGIVIGTANTAHDVAEDMVQADLSEVTMVQRSPTYVLPAEYYSRVQDMYWNDDIQTDLADQMMLTSPTAVARLTNMLVLNNMAKAEPERFDALERAGFKVKRYGDIIYQVYERFGGHYMDVGASAKISQGLIKIKSDAVPVHYTEEGLMFSDGQEIKTDVIIFATGFVGGMKSSVREMLGSDVADRIDDFWTLDKEGEIKGAFKPSGHPNLWMHGGTCTHARYMSRFVALQIRAALDGTPLKITSEGAPRQRNGL